MRTLAALATTAVTAVALSASLLPSAALAAPDAPTTTVTSDTSERAAKTTFKLKRSAKYSHYGQKGVKVTAVVKNGSRPAKGKVKFIVAGKKKTKKLKKGKAAYRLPKTLTPGTYKVKVKYRKMTRKTKVKVQNSRLKVSSVAFTISKATNSWDLPDLTGTVTFKGKAPDFGYVDIYQDGKFKGGNGSPNYCCMDSVSNGAFEFSGSTFLGKVKDKPVGTYKYQAFYTPTASYSEYIHSAFITVTVTN